MPLFTGGCLRKFRGVELVGRAPRVGRLQVFHRASGDLLVEALDDHRVSRRLFELRKADDDAEADEEDEDEDCARCQAGERADGELLDFSTAHERPTPSAPLTGGTSYITSP